MARTGGVGGVAAPDHAGGVALDDDPLRIHVEARVATGDGVDGAAQHVDAGEVAGQLLVADDVVAEQGQPLRASRRG